VALIGGKQRVRVPAGFAAAVQAYWRFVDLNGLRETIAALLGDLKAGKVPLAEVGSAIRRAFLRATWPPELAESIAASYRELCRRAGKTDAHAYAQ
jgi:pyruvate, water dikinase